MERLIFLPRTKPQRADYSVMYVMDKPGTTGDIGIEIECEGNKFQKQNLPGLWTYHQDGSLRGEDNAEYVLRKPIRFDEVPGEIDKLWEMFENYGTVLDDSNRTSVHIHLNMLKFHLNRMCSFFGLYFIVEELLTQWCGEHRVGNLFCLRARDATGIITCLKKFIQNDMQTEITQGFHYAGLNANALHKFGSIEIRTLRGVMDKRTILHWVAILRRLYELSAEYPDPRQVVEGFSGEGPSAFLEKVLGPLTGVVVNEIGWGNTQINASVYHGVRLAQDLCYCRDWSDYNPTEVETDPFGRKKKINMGASLYQPTAALDSIFTVPAAGWLNTQPEPEHGHDDEDDDDDHYQPEFDPDWDPEE